MKVAAWIWLFALVPGVAAAAPEPKREAHTVERVVAFVDGEPIWLTDLRQATVALRKQLVQLPEDKRASAKKDIFEQLLEREIERKLISKQAHALGVSVAPAEIDNAVAAVAKQNGVDVPALLAAVKKEGLTVAGYRAELAYQVLEAKLLRLRLARLGSGTPSLTLKRMEEERARWIKELKQKSRITIRVRP